jgi:hypothetical protein
MLNKTIKNIVVIFLLYSMMIIDAVGETTLGGMNYPTASSSPSITSGNVITNLNVVTGITINDDSLHGWTLTVNSSNGTSVQPRLWNSINGLNINYDLEINNISGTLDSGLSVSPGENTPLSFSGNSSTISATGNKVSSTDNYSFDLQMTIVDTSGKLAGDYSDTLTLTLESND